MVNILRKQFKIDHINSGQVGIMIISAQIKHYCHFHVQQKDVNAVIFKRYDNYNAETKGKLLIIEQNNNRQGDEVSWNWEELDLNKVKKNSIK